MSKNHYQPISTAIERLADRMVRDQGIDVPRLLEAILARLHEMTGSPLPFIEDWLARWEADRLTDVDRYASEVLELIARERPFTDVLGPLYMALSSRWKRQGLGQYFTPQPLAYMMTSMQIGQPKTDRLYTVADPAGGSGVMLLATAQYYYTEAGPASLRQLSVTSIDVDPHCVAMAGAQLIWHCRLHDAPLGEVKVYHGNSLGDQARWRLCVHAEALPEPRQRPERATRAPAAQPSQGELELEP